MTIASNTTKHHTVILFVPFIYRQHKKTFANAPGVWQGCNKRGVDHIPCLAVVLHLLRYYAINMRHAFSNGITLELCKNMRHGHIAFFTCSFYVTYNFIDHKLVIVFKTKRVLDRKTTTNIYLIKFRT